MDVDVQYKKGLWTEEEDRLLLGYIETHGRGHWNRIPKVTGLKRCGKSCRLRWLNYLSPNVKRGDFSEEEEDLIIRLHNLLGNRWSLIAGRVPGRTDNQVKNYWNTHLCKKLGIQKQVKRQHRASSKTTINKDSQRVPADLSSSFSAETLQVVESHSPFNGDWEFNAEPEWMSKQCGESLFLPDDYLVVYSPVLMEPFYGFPLD